MRIIPGLATLLFAAVVAAGPVAAQPIGPEKAPLITLPKETEEALRKGADQLLRAFKDAIDRLPRFEMPRIDRDGNIVIPPPRWPDKRSPVPTDEPIEI